MLWKGFISNKLKQRKFFLEKWKDLIISLLFFKYLVRLIFFGCYMDLSFFVVELYGIVLFNGFFNGGWIVFDLRY